jgi:hypothetical protein
MRKYRKLLQEIETSIADDEQIIALVGLLPPQNTISHSNIYNVGGRILLVSSLAVYAVQGKAVGRAEFTEIPLTSVYAPPRVTTRREALSLGKKIVRLAIDEQRGGNVETHMFIVDGEESAGQWMSEAVIREAEARRAELDRDDDQRLQQVVQAAVRESAGSTADELAKLAALRDQGVLTDDEFAQQKKRLLGE